MGLDESRLMGPAHPDMTWARKDKNWQVQPARQIQAGQRFGWVGQSGHCSRKRPAAIVKGMQTDDNYVCGKRWSGSAKTSKGN